ncbi:MAG TPA: polyphosphate--nucleotide phosphotransferase [Dysgonomonas sp.]|nr:polyphosphate--nucleotide phosphotransferase [Dysgonomonas sp.]
MDKEVLKKLLAEPGKKHKVSGFSTDYTAGMNKKEAKKELEDNTLKLRELQNVLYAHDRYAVLLIFQAMDAAGKDGTIKHVMSGVNPQGCQVFSFKQPSDEELDHDYLWRIYKSLPERGRIGIFNRSHYEDVLIAKVHPNIVLGTKLPHVKKLKDINGKFWEKRYRQINNFEEHLVENGTIVIKFFLNLSKDEQEKRFLARLEDDSKNWKFSASDLKERPYWDDYMKAYSDMLTNTSTKYAPWYVIPADNKWFMRYAVGQIICDRIAELDLHYPTLSQAAKEEIKKAKEELSSKMKNEDKKQKDEEAVRK